MRITTPDSPEARDGLAHLAVRATRLVPFALLLAWPLAAQAQSEWRDRTAVEAVAAVSVASGELTDPMVILDAVATVRMGAGFDVIVRPYSRRLPGGDWAHELYQLQVQYQSPTRIPIRVDAGVVTSPLGLGTLEMRPDRNPIIGAPFYYYMPLPRFDARTDRVNLLAPGYPIGVIVSASDVKWDLRGGVTDGTPARMRNALSPDRPPAAANVLAGGGWTPTPGLRVGGAVARGPYRPTLAAILPSADATDATVVTLEGEYAVGFTRVTAEWITDRFDTAGDPAVSRGYTLMAVRTLTPRVFVAARHSRASTPVQLGPTLTRRDAAGADATLGYRLIADITLRGGYQGFRHYLSEDWEHALALSVVWAHRWH
ncbi:MAG TPA: hypothetical protein VD833_06305 [Vicinamibacterales bacterium]|nr:hypothetical protein [Vicinamibacterales bacterium]